MTNKPRGQSFKDPMYDAIEARLEQKYGLVGGMLGTIRTKGERSNADQVSSAGARTVYQIIPSTRDAFLKKYGVDAYASPEAAAQVAALHLRDSMKRNGGNVELAYREYHGGTDRSQWGSVNDAYAARTTGKKVVDSGRGNGSTVLAPNATVTADDILYGNSGDFGPRRPLGPKPKQKSEKEQVRDLLTGGSVASVAAPDKTPDVSVEQAQQTADVAEEKRRASYTFMDRAKAAVEETHLIPAILRTLGDDHDEYDPEFHKWLAKNWSEVAKDAHSSAELNELLEAENGDDLAAIKLKQAARRERQYIVNTSGHGTAFQMTAGVLDPAGFVLGMGVGKAFQLAKVTGRVAATAAESAVANLAVTGMLDAAGEYTEAKDYAMSGVSGLVLGAAIHPLINPRSGKEVAEGVVSAELAEAEGALMRAAREEAGPNAAPQDIRAAADQIANREAHEVVNAAAVPVNEADRFLPADPESMLTRNKAVAGAVEQEFSVGAKVSDAAEAGLVREGLARAKQWVQTNMPAGVKLPSTVLEKFGQESTYLRLVKSSTNTLKMVAGTLLEGPIGVAGRRRTAAMEKVIHERLSMQIVSEFDRLASAFRREHGGKLRHDLWDGRWRKEFNKRIADEIEWRGRNAVGGKDTSPHVQRAVDAIERGFTKMADDQRAAGTVGALRLPENARGYLPHRMDPRAVVRLFEKPKQLKAVQALLQKQFQELNEYIVVNEGEAVAKKFDKDFAKTLAVKYLEIAKQRAVGRHEVPFQLHTPESADIVRDTLKAAGMPDEQIDTVMGKFSRGGASHTKKRLQLDLSADIGDGMTLQDLFVSDVMQLYRGYARRVSGEVALAKHGIMGKHGLHMLAKQAEAEGATPQEMAAFDQIAAEFLNTPFGNAKHAWMDDLRVATSGARLGAMAITQFGEFGNALAALGAARTFSAISSIPRLAKEVGKLKRGEQADSLLTSIDTLGGNLGMDDFQVSRIFDVKDNDIQLYNEERLGVLSRVIRLGAHGQHIASGHRALVAIQTRGMAEQIVRKAMGFIRDGKADKHLLDMGFTPEVQAVIRGNLDKIATFDKSGKLQSLDLLAGDIDAGTLMTIRDAVERGASQIIQRTYIGETGAWAHDGLLKMLFQFRTFSITALEKQWGRNAYNHGAGRAFVSLMGAMSFALPIHYARAHWNAMAMPEAKREEYLDKQLSPVAVARATMNYASASGLASDVLDLGGGALHSAGIIDDSLAPNPRGGGRGNLVGGVIAPGVGVANDVFQGAVSGLPADLGEIARGEYDGMERETKRLTKLLPGSNLPFVAPIIAGLTE